MGKLEILIPTTPDREPLLKELKTVLENQIISAGYQDEVSVVSYITPIGSPSIGVKRNYLIENSTAEYVAFFDSDDKPKANYIIRVMEGINKGVDCCSLRGIITWNGENPEVYEHSLIYSEWKTNDTGTIKYERYPNHLNAIKREIAIQFKFPDSNHGEDHDWSTQVFQSGLIKTEHYIDEVIYHYDYVPNK